MNKQLKNLIELSCNVSIYIPSTFDVDKKIDNSEKVKETLQFMGGIFGGCTKFEAVGSWNTENKGIVLENIVICKSYCDSVSLENNIRKVIDYCNKLKIELKQEAISLEVNNRLYFV